MTKPSSPSCQTFSDWGVVVPFTTPTLSHARLRPGRNGRLDVLMRNPSGGKGVYVFDLGALGELFTLTLHDRLLYERLVELDTPTPDTIRQAVRDVAAEGGRGPGRQARGRARARRGGGRPPRGRASPPERAPARCRGRRDRLA